MTPCYPDVLRVARTENQHTEKNLCREEPNTMAEGILEKVREIVIDELSVDADQVAEDATFVDDLGADSLDVVELVMRLEEEFDIEIPDEDAEKITTVGEAVIYINARVED